MHHGRTYRNFKRVVSRYSILISAYAPHTLIQMKHIYSSFWTNRYNTNDQDKVKSVYDKKKKNDDLKSKTISMILE